LSSFLLHCDPHTSRSEIQFKQLRFVLVKTSIKPHVAKMPRCLYNVLLCCPYTDWFTTNVRIERPTIVGGLVLYRDHQQRTHQTVESEIYFYGLLCTNWINVYWNDGDDTSPVAKYNSRFW